MVLQETWSFDGTVRENIAYGKEDATEEEIRQAAKRAYADGFIRRLSHGYDTLIQESGGILSGGQRQLLTIARAMLLDPDVYKRQASQRLSACVDTPFYNRGYVFQRI